MKFEDPIEIVRTGNIESLREMINSGVDLNGCNENDWTLLKEAVGSHHSEMVRELIRAGADVNLADAEGDTYDAYLSEAADQSIAAINLLM